MSAHVSLQISDASHVGEVRRAATGMASSLDFEASDIGRVAIVVTEATTNVIKHVGKGEVLIRALRDAPEGLGIEMLALDRGPGMADVARCFEDGYSTAGSPGTGLGAISRLANLLDVYSNPEQGTALLLRVFPRKESAQLSRGPVEFGVVRVPAPGETTCGDAWAAHCIGDQVRVMLADGLGHGVHAAEAATKAAHVLEAQSHLPVAELFNRMHDALLATRGAAVSVAEIDLAAAEVLFSGTGNVSGFLAWPGGSRSMATQNGTIGAHFTRARVASYPMRAGSVLFMHTDGVTSRTNVDAYPGLLVRHPTLIAGVLYRDFLRGKDDATIVVAREFKAGP